MEALSTIIGFGSVGTITASFLFTAAALALGSYLYAPYWAVRKVPGPLPLPLIGHLHLMAKHGPGVFSVLANRYGPIFRFHMGRQPLIMVASAELFREVGIKKFKDLPNHSVPSAMASPLHLKGLFSSKDKRWSTMRNTIVSFYQPSHLASLIPMMQATIDSMIENLIPSEDEDINFCDMSLKLTIDAIGKAAFGVDFGLTSQAPNPGLENNATRSDSSVTEFLKQHMYSTTQLKMDLTGSFSMIVGLVFPMLQEPFRQVLRRVPGTMDWKVDRTSHKLSQMLDEIVSKRSEETDRGSNDFLSLILNARASEKISGKIFSFDYISALTYEHMLAGSTSTSFTLSSIVYLVSGHPEVERKMLEEIDTYGPRTLSASDLQNEFPYMDQVIKEALRFYFASPLIARETSTQVEIGGYTLPKGTWVWLAPDVQAKDPKNFPEPDKFKPERFDPSCEEEQQRHPYAFIPFGIGPRSCLGQKFALQEIKLALISLYRKYVFRHAPSMKKPVEFEYGIILNFKHDVKVRAIKRNLN